MGMNNNSSFKRFFSIIGIIFIGAIGSGLWDVFLKDLVYNTGNLFVEIVSHFYIGYVDSLYENVGKSDSVLQYLPALFILICIIIPIPLYFILIFNRLYNELNRKDEGNVESDKVSLIMKLSILLMKSKIRIYSFILVTTLPLSIGCINIIIKETTNYNANIYIERALEIIRPNIDQPEYFILRGEYRQIDNKYK